LASFSDTALVNGTGIFGATLYTITTAATITASSTAGEGATPITSGSIIVDADPYFVVSFPPNTSTTTAGNQIQFYVTANMPSGSPDGNYSGTVHFTSSDPQADLPLDLLFTNGVGIIGFYATLKTAGNETITVTDVANSNITGRSPAIAVSPASFLGFAISAPTEVGASSQFMITVRAVDAYSNTVTGSTGYTGTVHFSSSDAASTLPADSTLTNGVGIFAVVLATVGNQSITVTDSQSSAFSGNVSTTVVQSLFIQFGVVAEDNNGNPIQSVYAGSTFQLVITAEDQNGQPIGNVYGAVALAASNEDNDSLDAGGWMANGVLTVTIYLDNCQDKNGLTQTLTVTWTLNNNITGSTTILVLPNST